MQPPRAGRRHWARCKYPYHPHYDLPGWEEPLRAAIARYTGPAGFGALDRPRCAQTGGSGKRTVPASLSLIFPSQGERILAYRSADRVKWEAASGRYGQIGRPASHDGVRLLQPNAKCSNSSYQVVPQLHLGVRLTRDCHPSDASILEKIYRGHAAWQLVIFTEGPPFSTRNTSWTRVRHCVFAIQQPPIISHGLRTK